MSGSPPGRRSCARPGWRAAWTQLRARAFLDLLLARTPAPARTRPAPGRRGPGRVRRAGHPDRPAGHLDQLAGPARRARRARPGRPLAGPRPGHRRRSQPQDHLVLDRHRRPRARYRARLRPSRTQEATGNALAPDRRGSPSPRPAGTAPPGGYGTWRLHTPGTGPDLIVTIDPLTTDPCDHRFESPGPRSRRQAPAPVPGPARHLHQPDLPAARRPVRLRAQHRLRSRRTYVLVQHRP